METANLVAIAVALLVGVVGLARAAAARRELVHARADLEKVRSELEETREKLKALKAAEQKKPKAAKEAAPAPAPKKKKKAPKADAKPEPKPAEPEPPPPEPEKPKVSREVRKRAEKMLKDARLLAQHVGFENQIDVKGHKCVRVTVPIETELDGEAFDYMCETTDAIMESGDKDGDRFIVIHA